ncbi:MAG: M48 family metallopeptidase [Synechococcus sp. SB0672_bin_10]|nr:M48 family metallopeptidase [Synechococcus sp. SB0672_bin_10]
MTAVPEEVLGLRVEVIRSMRRTAALHVVGNELQVRIPERLGDEWVAAILQQKRPWIRAKVAQWQPVPPCRPRELVSGESFPYLGRNYRLKVLEGHQVGVRLAGGYLRTTVRPDEQGAQRQRRIRQYLEKWYRSRALERLREKTNRHARQIGVTPTGISVRSFKSRWGSCNTTGHLAFNWNIVKAPHAIANYVVIHELCHLVHPNHSKDFWRLVRCHDDAYGEHKQWLKEQAGFLLGDV